MQPGLLRRSLRLLLAFALVLSQLVFLTATTAFGAPIVTVNSTGDDADATPGDGICHTGGVNSDLNPECTLRAAIQEANASSVDEIYFDIPTSEISGGLYVIEPLTVLPWISEAVSLDATTQPDFGGTPIVVVDGSVAPTSPGGTDGLLLETGSDGSTIRGLVVRDFEDDGIEIHANDTTVVGNRIYGNDSGVLIENGSDNIVGGLTTADRNVISGNTNGGIVVHAGDRSVVRGNYIGVDSAGSASLANQGHGVVVESVSTDVTVGPGNVISGNTGAGVRVDDAGATTTILGNYVGLDASGTSSIPNGTHGISIGAAADIVDIDGTAERNVISGNTEHGVHIEFGAAVVTIENNRIGTDATGNSAVGNGQDGVRADADDVVIVDNQVSGNGVDGLRVERLGAVVKGNLIGTDSAGTAPVPNGDDGVDTGSGTSGTMIGGTAPGDGNTIAFNTDNGIVLRALSGTTAAIVSNSIHGNGGLGIDLADDGPTSNDSFDLDPGPPNDLLNFPVITSAATAGSTVYIDFELDAPVGWHRIELFENPSGTDPSGFGEGQTLVASTEVFHDGSGSLPFGVTYAGSPGGELSATTTFCPAVGCPTLLETSEFSATETIVVGNNAPVLDPIADDTVDELSFVSFTANATDPDPGDALTFSLDGEPAGAVIDPNTGVFSWTPSEAQGPGVYTFDVTVTDDGTPATLSDADSVTITVNEVNVTPDLANPADQTVDEQTTLSFTAAASDADLPANALVFSLTGEPSGATIDANTGVLSWTPTEAQGPGVYTFDITVTDDGTPSLADTETIQVTVDEVNVAPTITNPGDQSNAEADPVNVPISAADTDDPANTLSYSASGLPPGVTIDPTTGTITGTIAFNGSDSSPYTTTVTVTDDGTPNLDAQTTFTWTVTNVNLAPDLNDPADQTVDEQTTLNFTATASDPDSGDVLTFSLDNEPSGAVIDPLTGVFSWTPTEAQGPGLYTFDITVSDNATLGLDDTETIQVTVDEVNRPPVLGSIANATVDELTTVTFTATAGDPDVPANSLTYKLVGAPAGATINPATGVFAWLPTEAQGPGAYSFAVVVSDSGTPRLSDSQTVQIVVREVNEAPTGVDDWALTAEDVPVTVDVLANDSDPNGDALIISVVTDPSDGVAEVTAEGRIRFTPADDFHGEATFVYEVSDGIATDTAVVTVTVLSVNDPPVALDDSYRLGNYRPARLDVLANDSDPDGDPLGISFGTEPAIGSVSIEDGNVLYKPRNGWTGSVKFTYFVNDSKGGVSEASVAVVVGDEVLIGARNQADGLGAGLVAFDPPGAAGDGLGLIDIDGISLLADSFFQTVGALRIPLGFLGLAVAMIVGLGRASQVPALIVGSRRRHWSVVRLSRSQRLPAYTEPGGRKVVYSYDPTSEGIVSLGNTKVIGNTEWLPVDTPNGDGWLYRNYLTEQVDLKAFIDDPRPIRLVHELASRLRRGKSIGSIVSQEGLIIALTGPPTQIAPGRLSSMLHGSRLRNLPNNGKAPNAMDDFNIAVTEPFLEAYDATPDITAKRAHSSSALIPTECWNLPYLALGSRDGGQPWLVFFEYRNGRAWIAGIGVDE